MKLKSRIANIDNKKVEIISQKYCLPQKISQIILSRIDYEDVESFIFPNLNSLFAPYLIKDMPKVIDKINYIKNNNLKVVVFGDYDVDGITSTALLYTFFKEINIDVNYYIPTRTNGYGLTQNSINEVIEKFSPDVIFTVDCGISSVEEVEYIKSKNIDIVITDHHQRQEILPDTLIINPHLENLKFKDLCGVGVAFKIVEAYYNRNKKDIVKYLPIVAIGTIADVVPLISDNRIMVQIGFQVASFLPKGIKKLLAKLELNEKDLNSQTIAFKIAPILNSVGRLKSAEIALRLFISNDEEELENLSSMVIETNKERQAITEEIFKSAEEQILKEKLKSVIVLKDASWDSGVIGIVASKLVEKYKRTTILFSEVNGVLKGSCRSLEGVNIFDELTLSSEYIVQFGGHEKAAGLTVSKENFENFKNLIEKNIAKTMKNIEVLTKYDVEILPQEIDLNFAKKLSILEPFGECNPPITFLLNIKSPTVEFFKNSDKHLLIKYQNLKIKYFNAEEQMLNYKFFKNSLNLVKISSSVFNGYEYLNIICDKAIYSDFNTFIDYSLLSLNAYKILIKNLNFSNYKKEKLININDKDNYIIVCYNIENFKELEKTLSNQVVVSVGSVSGVEKRKNLCYGLKNLEEVKNYENVYFCEESVCKSLNFDNKTLLTSSLLKDLNKISLTKEKLTLTYLGLKNYLEQNDTFILENFNEDEMYVYFKSIYYNFNLSMEEFLISLLVLIELNILTFKENQLQLNSDKKCDLNLSKIYTEF